MRTDDVEDKARTRAEPLPEEAAAERPGDDRRAKAASILAESEERIDAASGGRPGDAANEHRRSEDTAD